MTMFGVDFEKDVTPLPRCPEHKGEFLTPTRWGPRCPICGYGWKDYLRYKLQAETGDYDDPEPWEEEWWG